MKCVSSFYIDFKTEHDRMIRSLLYFHPEVNLEILSGDEVRKISYPIIGYPFIELPLFYKYSTVTHIDADVIVVDRIDELFDDSTDIRAGRNNSDNGRCATHAGITIPNVTWDKYVNAGIHSISSVEFMEEWKHLVETGQYNFGYGEQDSMNYLFHNGKYNSKILDPLDFNIHYGTSMIEGTVTYWDLWKEIVVVTDHLELRGKRLKMLHIAGGGATKTPLESLVIPEVVEFIRSITG
jgi:hypothetical protein